MDLREKTVKQTLTSANRFLAYKGAVLMAQTTTRASATLATKDEIVTTIAMTVRHLHA